MNNTVCAVMVTYNRLEILKSTLAHVLDQEYPPTNIIIVDNYSTDGTKEYLQTLLIDQRIKTIHLDTNMGAGYAISQGMKLGLKLKDFDYFWVLDDDSYYKDNVLKDLVTNISKSDFALVGLSGSNIRFGTKRKVHTTQPLTEVDYALVDGAIIRGDVIRKIGTTSERFFMMCDDDEYIIRLKKHGYKIGLLDLGPVNRLHLGGQGSFTKATLWRGYYSSRNQMLILKEYFSLKRLLEYTYLQSKLLIGAAVFAPDRFQRVRLRIKGIWHGVRGVEGKTLDPKSLTFDSKRSN
jgi:rhamnopyranosyl-N-acetylglucosaminyl-diphospho-decaprenol beta-1,3/1,4-galactofuranosyltransferase